MKVKLFASAAACAIALGGVSLEWGETTAQGASFINPLAMLGGICGDGGEIAARRALFLRAAAAYAASQVDADGAAPSFAGVDGVGYEISTGSAEAQAQFDAGVAHMWNFNHGAAVAAFKAAQAADPGCAMCFWGEALALGPNINAPMDPEANGPAYAAYENAFSLRDGANEREKALINALSYRYSAAPPEDRAKLDAAFADAMRDVAADFPEDDFIAVTAAEANMDTQPWDYWETDKRTPKGRTAETLSLVEAVLARNPDYQAAIHLYIHLTEASTNPYRAASYADALGELSPGLGHLIHMPSHVYYRI
ncbi:MAG: hypothetical protein AAGJ87_14445, partial [Pseudomonadota bacterium]